MSMTDKEFLEIALQSLIDHEIDAHQKKLLKQAKEQVCGNQRVIIKMSQGLMEEVLSTIPLEVEIIEHDNDIEDMPAIELDQTYSVYCQEYAEHDAKRTNKIWDKIQKAREEFNNDK